MGLQAGAELADDADLSLAGVDCTQPSAKKLCEKYDVKGYPTLKLFESGYSKKNKAKVQYNGNFDINLAHLSPLASTNAVVAQ